MLEDDSMLFMNDAEFEKNTKPAIVVVEFRRSWIEAGNISSALSRLHTLTDDRPNVLLYKESLMFSVTGYESDPRELVVIPEVRAFFQKLNKEWPHWVWFLAKGANVFSMLISFLCELHIQKKHGLYSFEFADSAQLYSVLTDMVERSTPLFELYEIDEAIVVQALGDALKELGFENDATDLSIC